MVNAEVQQVTTQSKTKQSEWEIQEVVWKEAKEWVDEANNNNVTRMLRENYERDITLENSGSRQEEITTQSPTNDESWQVLADCQIWLPLAGLLKLVPLLQKWVGKGIKQLY